MKNNYNSLTKNNFKKITTPFRMVVLAIVFVASFGFNNNLFAQVPPAPVAVAATNITCTSLNANWSAVSGAVAYYLDFSTDISFSTFVSGYNNVNVGNVLTYNITGLMVNQNYYYRLRVTDGTNTSLNSNVILVNSASVSAPSTLGVSNVTCTSFNANWGPSLGADAYHLDVSTSGSFSTFISGYNNLNIGNVSTYTVTGLTANTNYYYRLRASNGCTTGTNSSAMWVITGNPSAPVALAADNFTCTSMNVNWSASVGATNYFLDVSADPIFSTFLSGFNNANCGNVTTYNITGLTINTTYYYRIRAANGCSTSLNSNTVSISTTATSSPVVLQATNESCAAANANWSASTNATTYYLDVATDPLFSNFVTGYSNLNVGNVLTYGVTGLSSSTTYYYRVRSSNGNGCYASLNSNSITFTTTVPANPNAPTALAASNINCTSLSANWTGVSSATGYFLDVSTDVSFASTLSAYSNLLVGNVLMYNITGLSTGMNYYYRVRTLDGCGTSTNSNSISVYSSGVDAPVGLAASNINCTSFNANWAPVSGALTYYIDVSTSAAFSTFVIGYNNMEVYNITTYNITGLSINTTYYYRVRAVNSCSSGSNSNTVILNTAAPSVPVATSASDYSCSSFNANWNSSPGALTYYLDVSTDALFSAGSFLIGYQNYNVNGNVTTYPIFGLAANTTYYYRVRAENACATSINSNTITFATSSQPSLSSSLSPPAICSSNTFNYIMTSTSPGATFSWGVTQNGVTGATIGSGSAISEVLSATGSGLGTVIYSVTVTANGCSGTDNVTVTVNPLPTLLSTLTPPAICSGSVFNYAPTSATSGTTFAWTRATVSGISNASANGTGNPNETLVNTAANPVSVTYLYSLTANGCTNTTSYSVLVVVNPTPTLSSTITPADIFTGNTFSYTPTSNVPGATFAWSRAVVAGISNAVAAGTNNPSEVLFNTTGNSIPVTYVYTVTANGCTNPTTYSVVVVVNTPAVWPGDANHDSIVNNNDLLAVGLYYMQTGTPRASQGNVWQAYIADNWGSLQNNNEDLKHADCNGDGTIDDNDTLAINANFNLTHAIAPPLSSGFEDRATSDMYFVINGSAFAAGDWVPVEIWVGTSGTPINSLYGVSFNINYNASLVQSGTESISFSPSWLGTPGTDVLKIAKVDDLANTAYGAITRKDHMNMSGFGKVADFKFQLKSSIVSADSMYLSFSNYMAVDSMGLTQSFTTSQDTIVITPAITGVKERSMENKLTVYPNPFNSFTTLSFEKELNNATVKIVDVLGKEVRLINVSGKQLIVEKNELNAGIYFVKVIAEQKIVAQQKIIIQ